MEVALVRWPHEAERRMDLVAGSVARLLLVEDGAVVPDPPDCLEDWIRLPVDEQDLQARVAALQVRATCHREPRPRLDAAGVLRVDGAWVNLPPIEARLAAVLLEGMDVVVSREALARAGWPDGMPGRNLLDVHVLRLRRRLAEVGLAIRTVRSRGYLLERSGSVQERVRDA